MITPNDIRRCLQAMNKNARPSILGKVKKVDTDARTCSIEDDGLEIFGIRLQCITDNDKSVVVIPKEGARALAVNIEGGDAYQMVSCSEIETLRIDVGDANIEIVEDKIAIELGESTVEIEDGTITFNGGDNDGLVKIQELTNKLNAIEDYLNSLKTIFSTTWIPAAQDGGAGLKGAAADWSAQTFVKTQKSELENTKIKH